MMMKHQGIDKHETSGTHFLLRIGFGSFQRFPYSFLLMSSLRRKLLFPESQSPLLLFRLLGRLHQIRRHGFDRFKKLLQLVLDVGQHLEGVDVSFVVADARSVAGRNSFNRNTSIPCRWGGHVVLESN